MRDEQKSRGPAQEPTSNGHGSRGIAQHELEQLRQQVAELQQDKAELERKRFVDTSLSQFADTMRLRIDSTLDGWSENLLMELIPFVQGLQGAIYILEEEEEAAATEGQEPAGDTYATAAAAAPEAPPADAADAPAASASRPAGLRADSSAPQRYLRLIGGYALPDGAPQQIPVGQGVTGQVAKAGEELYYDEPGTFEAHTESGLTEIQARALLILPLIQNEAVVGVLELTALQPFGEAQLDFLRRLCDTVAGNLLTLQNQVRIQRLYEHAQQRQEQLQAQEEEMRQNVEELEATQEEMKRVQQELEDAKAMTDAVFDNANVMITATDLAGNITIWNKMAEKLSGFTRQEAMNGMDFLARHIPEEIDREGERLQAEYGVRFTNHYEVLTYLPLQRGEIYQQEWTYYHKDGSTFPIELTLSALRNAQGEINGLVGIGQDISQRKQRERENRRLASIIENSDDFIAIGDPQSLRYTFINAAGRRMVGIGEEEPADNYLVSDVLDQETMTLLQEEVIARIMRGESYRGEFKLYPKGNGEAIITDGAILPLHNPDTGQVDAIASVQRDVTEERQRQHELQQAADMNRELFENNLNALWVMGSDGLIRHANWTSVHMFGMEKPEDFHGERPMNFSAPLQENGGTPEEEGPKKMGRLWEDGQVAFEWRFKRRDTGEEFDCYVQLTVFEYAGDKMINVVQRDITEEKRQRRAALEAKELMEAVFENAGFMIATSDLQSNLTSWNRKAAALLGYSYEEAMAGLQPKELLDHKELQAEAERIEQEYGKQLTDLNEVLAYEPLKLGTTYQREWTLVHRDGSRMPGELTVTAMRDQAGNPTGLIALVQDISQRKEREAEIRRALSLLQNSRDLIATLDPEALNFYYLSEAGLQMIQYDASQTYQSLTLPQLLPADELERFRNTVRPRLEANNYWRGEWRLKTYAGDEELWVDATFFPVHDEHQQQLDRIGVVMRDITQERRQRHQMAVAQEIAHVAPIVLEAKRGMLVFTDAAYAQVGTDARAQGGGYHWPVESFIEEVVASADQSGFEKFLSKAPQQTGELSRTIRIHRLDNGQLHYIKFAFYNEAQTGESDTVIHGAMQEITQQRLREQELEEVAKRSRTRFKHSLDAILVLEEERITECNPAAVDTFGVGEAEALEGRNLLDFAPREQAGGTASTEAWRKLQAALQEKGHAVETLRLQRADGTPFEAELVAHRLARHGAPLVEMILRDLTALAGRVHQEAEAHQPALHAGLNGLSPEALQKQVAAAIGDAEIAFWAYDFQEETLQLTDAAKHLLGYAPQEVSEGSAGLYELLKPEDQPRWEAQLAAVRQGQQNVLKIALQLKQRRGGYRKLIFKGEAHWNGDTTPHRLQGVMLLATYSAPAEGST